MAQTSHLIPGIRKMQPCCALRPHRRPLGREQQKNATFSNRAAIVPAILVSGSQIRFLAISALGQTGPAGRAKRGHVNTGDASRPQL